jgi:hypothetical protein
MSQETMERKCETLILLVGSNPLPNYLTATLLRPNRLFLIHTPETRPPAERLNCVLGDHAKIEMRGLAKASDAREIAEAIRRIISDGDPQQVHLNYTGGTKIMAAHARMAFRENGGKDQNASYLNDGARCLFFDDGRIDSLEKHDLVLTLDLIGRLHGCERLPSSGGAAGGPTESDARIVAAKVAPDAKFAKSLCDTAQRFKEGGKVQKALEDPWRPQDVCLKLSAIQVPEEEWDDNRFKAWQRFLGGGWLEVAVAAWIKDATGASPSQGVYWRLKGRPFEIDVVLIRNHRLYVISCTTDNKLGLCKSKLFEVAMRSRQLGGDLARSALVCLIDGQDGQGKYIDQLRGDVASVWEAPNKPQVFGLADLREWTATAGSPNLGSLKCWLDS